jgi:hypothetical protein
MKEQILSDEAEDFMERIEHKKHKFVAKENRKMGYIEPHSYFN